MTYSVSKILNCATETSYKWKMLEWHLPSPYTLTSRKTHTRFSASELTSPIFKTEFKCVCDKNMMNILYIELQ